MANCVSVMTEMLHQFGVVVNQHQDVSQGQTLESIQYCMLDIYSVVEFQCCLNRLYDLGTDNRGRKIVHNMYA